MSSRLQLWALARFSRCLSIVPACADERGLTVHNELLAAALKSESLPPTVCDVACQVFIMTVFSQFPNSKPAQHAYSTLSTSTLVNVNKIHFHRFVCPVFFCILVVKINKCICRAKLDYSLYTLTRQEMNFCCFLFLNEPPQQSMNRFDSNMVLKL